MTILLVTTHLNPGGITRYLFNLAKGLKQRGHSVHIASRGGAWETKFRDAGIGLVAIPLDTKSIFSFPILQSFWRIRTFLKTTPVDMIHANTRVSQFLAALVSRFGKVPYVCTFHGEFKPRFFRKIFKSSGVLSIAISQHVKQHMRDDLGISEWQIRVVLHGVDEKDYQTSDSKEIIRKKYGISGLPVVGIVARLTPEKNHRILIEAFRLFLETHPQAELVMLGDGRIEGELKALVAAREISDKVIFLKHMNAEEIFPCFDIFVLPSTSEGFGLSAAEALLLGVPAVVAGVGGLVEIVEHEKTGLILRDIYDSFELCRCLKNLTEDAELRGRLIRNGRENIRKNLSLSQMVTNTEAVYREALKIGNKS